VRKLRVGFFIDAWNPGAGTENQLLGILRNLDKARIDARLFTLREPIPEQFRREIPWPVECLQVRHLMSAHSLFKFMTLVRRLRRERLDIVSVYFVDTNLFVIPAARLAGIKGRVVNRRDMGYWYEPGILGKLNRVNRLAGWFLVNSEAVKKAVVKNECFPAERIKVIYNGMWEPVEHLSEPYTRRELGVPENAPTVGIVANLRPVKRVDRFIEMAAIVARTVPDAHYLVAGQGELEPGLRSLASRLGLQERIHFLGSVADVRRLLPAFDVGALTSESEGLSNALIEYAAAGVPAVTFDVGGNREIIHHEVNGLLAADGDVAGLAANAVTLLRDPALRRQYASAGCQLVRQLFDPAEVMRLIHEFFEAVANAPDSRPRID